MAVLQDSETRYNLVARATSDAIWDWNLQTNEYSWNDNVETLFGYRKAKVGPDFAWWAERLHPDDTDRVMAGIKKVLDLGVDNWSDEYRFRRVNGAYANVMDRGFVVHDDNARAIRMIGSKQDITERRRVEEEGKRFFKLSLSPLCVAGFDGYFKIVNPAWERIFGYAAADVTAVPFVSFVHPDDKEATIAEAMKLAAGADTVAFENRYRCKDSSYRWMLWNATAFINEQLIYCVAHDVTERKATETALTLRTEELARSNAELAQFASIASHDLQEPLRKIQTFGSRLQDKYSEVLDSQGLDYLARMASAAERMQALIQELLILSRVTIQAQAFVPVDLAQVAREVLDDLETRIERSGGKVEIGLLPTVSADPLQMRQLLQNLIGNGLKYQLPDAVPVVRVTAVLTENDSICDLEISDNGIGFDEQYAERIFAPFQRLHSRSEYEGTGMGLAICRKIVERHRGTIRANSSMGTGATFVVSLPMSQVYEETPNVQ